MGPPPGYYVPTPSPADSGVMSPMTPLSTYTQGSTPEQGFMTSPEHLNYAQYENTNYTAKEYGSTADTSPYSSDEGVVLPKQFFETFDQGQQQWTLNNTV